jgi:hypothetical protein
VSARGQTTRARQGRDRIREGERVRERVSVPDHHHLLLHLHPHHSLFFIHSPPRPSILNIIDVLSNAPP